MNHFTTWVTGWSSSGERSLLGEGQEVDMLGDTRRVAAALVIGALFIGACGGGGDDQSGDAGTGAEGSGEFTAESIRALADDSDEAQTYAFDMDVAFTGLSAVEGVPEGTPDEVNVTVTGATDLAASKTTIDLDLTEVMSLLPGGADAGESTIRAVIDGEDAYINLGAMGAPYGIDGSKWIKTTLDEVNAAVGGVSGSGSPSATNPASFTDLFRGVDADEDVEVQGREEVRGEQVTHLIANANVAAAIAAAPAEQKDAVEAQFGALGVDEVPLHVWLGDDGIPRRLELIAERGQFASLQGVGMTVVIEPYDVGKPVTVEVPAEDDLVPPLAGAPATTAPAMN
jgi:hypothetical protein